MPIWGWVCVGLTAAVAVALALLVWAYNLRLKRLMRDGQTVVARVLLANPSLYQKKAPAAFEAAFVVFTRDNDASEGHLAYLGEVCERLKRFTPGEHAAADERKVARALATQTTVGEEALRLPEQVTGGREAYFSTPNVFRRMLPEGMLTREYIYLQVLIDGQHRDVTMIEYPDAQGQRPAGGRSP
jgi:hypothetical protein